MPADVVSPNDDTLCNAAWLELRAEPRAPTVPDCAGRFCTSDLGCISRRRLEVAAGAAHAGAPADLLPAIAKERQVCRDASP